MTTTTNTKRMRVIMGEGEDLPARMAYGKHERDAVHAEKRRLAVRASYGKEWDGKADNNNIAWPLAKALLAEGNHDLLKYAMAYRKIYDQAKAEIALGFKGTPPTEMTIVRRNYVDESTGKITYGGEIVSKAASVDKPAMRAMPTNPDSKKRAAPVPRPWTGDVELISAMDAREKLSWLQGMLGPLVEPFEMACIDGATLAEVGGASGASSRDGKPAAGRAVCHLALITIRDAIGGVARRDLAA